MAYNSCGAPRLLSYQDAKKHHDSVKPIRGKTIKPLGNRRWYHASAITMHGDDVVLLYLDKPCVVWHPDNSLTVHGPVWSSAYEPDKLARYLPLGLSFEWNEVRLVLHNEDTDQRVLLGRGEQVRLTPNGTKPFGFSSSNNTRLQFAFESLPVEHQYVKRRGRSAHIMRRELTPFFEWLTTVIAVTREVSNEEFTQAQDNLIFDVLGVTRPMIEQADKKYNSIPWNSDSESDLKKALSYDLSALNSYPFRGKRLWGRGEPHLAGIQQLYNWMMLNNQERWHDALCILGGMAGARAWDHSLSKRLYRVEGQMDAIKEYIEQIICFVHRDEVFERVELREGAIPKRKYGEFFSDYRFQYFTEIPDTVSVSSN